ncbi:hypothetical protein CMMCAS08_10785 [Clavibacter michiganensis subsp. michiganensis]|nr:hypothetical protein DOU02_15515 [Clavibacter michiganensis subsp. michiganensis]OUD97431.1 hypothetical protein CMMCAS06_04505 [Clavibacter michiganensis subsp. michiganensis]OUE07250.1 hypothetical protein CMMCAS08_10785 [Clavibacter michiganensis subsp. michiganensis]OUE11158.1 hypothetical protein CMMCA001_14360 [Clavibacter michiganensis subsp. michiganensis]
MPSDAPSTSSPRPASVGRQPSTAPVGTASGTPSARNATRIAPATTALPQRNRAPATARSVPTTSVIPAIRTNDASR